MGGEVQSEASVGNSNQVNAGRFAHTNRVDADNSKFFETSRKDVLCISNNAVCSVFES